MATATKKKNKVLDMAKYHGTAEFKVGDITPIKAEIAGCPVGTAVEVTEVKHDGAMFRVKTGEKEFLVTADQV